MSLVKLGIVGAGNLSTSRIYPCLRYAPVQLEAVCDQNAEKAERNARLFGARRVYTDYKEMFSRGGLDAVIVCIGPEQHASLSVEAMEAGLHVYTEKPPAVTAADARRVLEVSRATGKICMTAFKKRFAPAYRKARAYMEAAGGVRLLSIDYCSGAYANNPENPRSDFLLDFAIHIIDLSRFLGGEVRDVACYSPDPSNYAVLLRFESGAVGTLALSANRSWQVSCEKVELTGPSGRFVTVENSTELVAYDGERIAEWHKPSFSTARGDSLIETGFAGEIVEFAQAVRDGHTPESSIESSYRTMELYEAIRRAAEADRVRAGRTA